MKNQSNCYTCKDKLKTVIKEVMLKQSLLSNYIVKGKECQGHPCWRKTLWLP